MTATAPPKSTAPWWSPPGGGCTVSFSAGSRHGDPAKFRIVSGNSAGRLAALLEQFPALGVYFTTPPLLLNAYPATLPPPPGVTFVDSYGRWQTFAAGLSLAAGMETTCIITAMPLAVAHLLLSALHAGTQVPSRVLLLLGGYYCPSSLESFLVGLLEAAGVTAKVLHLYGVGEIDAGLLAGQRAPDGCEILYKSIDPRWYCQVQEGFLVFHDSANPQTMIHTEDAGDVAGEGIVLRQPSTRLDGAVYGLLESWTPDDWARRTGHLHWDGETTAIQCRQNVRPDPDQGEWDYHDYCRRFDPSWLDKPRWNWQAEAPEALQRAASGHALPVGGVIPHL